jgi:hypothetical protein
MDVSVRRLARDGLAEIVEQAELIDGEAVFKAMRCCGAVRGYKICYSLPGIAE